jgi:IS5 family transposase
MSRRAGSGTEEARRSEASLAEPLDPGDERSTRRGGFRSRYRLREQTVEPVFGQIKSAMGFGRFLLRGLDSVRGEWSLVCTAHNLRKLARATA